jgi:membrane dipeptidase
MNTHHRDTKNPLTRAQAIHFSAVVIDTHADTTQRLLAGNCDLGIKNPLGAVDIPRLKAGGVTGIFFAVWIPGSITGATAVHRALSQIDLIRETVRRYPEFLTLAVSSKEIRRARAENKVAVLIGVEGGHMIASDLCVLRCFSALGARYMTLTHGQNTEWADSCTDKPLHRGLSDFGKQVIREMNRHAMLVDVSHSSDETAYAALEASCAPIIASHSCCRTLCPTARNASDEMMRALARRGGLLQINFHTGFLDETAAKSKNIAQMFCQMGSVGTLYADDPRRQALACQEIAAKFEQSLPRVEWTRIVDHIDHAVEIMGPKHVGLGSDFDGGALPQGMQDVSCLPKITAELVCRGYKDRDIENILGGNVLRVMSEAEEISDSIRRTK